MSENNEDQVKTEWKDMTPKQKRFMVSASMFLALSAVVVSVAVYEKLFPSEEEQARREAAKLEKAQVQETVDRSAVSSCEAALRKGKLSAESPSHRFNVNGISYRCDFEKTTLSDGISQIRVIREMTEADRISRSYAKRPLGTPPGVVKTFDVK